MRLDQGLRLGLPDEMNSYLENGCAPEFALWSFVDLGYLTYYASYLLATGAIQGVAGESFEAGRMGTYTHRGGPDPAGYRRVAHRDGAVLGLQRGQSGRLSRGHPGRLTAAVEFKVEIGAGMREGASRLFHVHRSEIRERGMLSQRPAMRLGDFL